MKLTSWRPEKRCEIEPFVIKCAKCNERQPLFDNSIGTWPKLHCGNDYISTDPLYSQLAMLALKLMLYLDGPKSSFAVTTQLRMV